MKVDVIVADFTTAIPGSRLMGCSECASSVALAPSGQATLRRNPQARVLCMRCGMMSMRNDPDAQVAPITDRQRAEARAARRPQG
jgi:hypothetical protein